MDSGISAKELNDTSVAPELDTHLEYLLRASPECIAAERPQLWKIVQAAIAASGNPHLQHTYLYAGQIVDWRLFGKNNDPLPSGLVVAHSEVASPHDTILFDERHNFSTRCYKQAIERFSMLGLTAILKTVTQDLAERQEEVRQTLRLLIASSKTYQLVQSFDLPRIPGYEVAALSPTQRQIREQQIIHDIRRRFGLISPHSDRHITAQLALEKELYLLDQETVWRRQKMPPAQDGRHIAHNYFQPKIVKTIVNDHASFRVSEEPVLKAEDFIDFRHYDGRICAYFEYDNRTLHDELKQAAREFCQQLTGELEAVTSPGAKVVSYYFLTTYIESLFDPQIDMPHSSIVEQAVNRAIESCIRSYPCVYSKHMLEYDLLVHLRVHERGEIAKKVLDDLKWKYRKWHIAHGHKPGFSSLRQIAEQEATTIGRTLLRPPHDTAPRLIQVQARDALLPSRHAAEDLRLRFEPEFFKNQDPYIPGYRLTSRADHEFSFIEDPAGNPYAPALHPLSQEQQHALMEAYAQLGLTALVKAMSRAESLTVEELRLLLRSHRAMRYVAPKHVSHSEKGGDFPHEFNPQSLQDFAFLVKKGLLRVQCTIAADFSRLSLHRIFGPVSADKVGGYVLGKIITAVTHAQTSLAIDGRSYLLEATPSRRRRFSMGGREKIQPSSTPPPVTQISVPPMELKETILESVAPTPKELRRLQLRALRTSFEAQLQIVCGLRSNEQLYKKITGLTPADPLRRSLSAVIRAGNGNAGQDELTTLIAYITNYSAASDTMLSKRRLPHYNAGLLDYLKQTLQRVVEVLD